MFENERKLPPQNIEAEQSVLGAILIDAEAMHRIVDILRPEYFYKEAHKHIYSGMIELVYKSEPIDLVTLSDRLHSKQVLENIGGASYLAELTGFVSTSANVEYYAKIVEEKAMLRKLISTGSEIVENAFSEGNETSAILDSAEQKIFEIANDRVRKGFVHIKTVLKDVSNEIENMGNNDSSMLGVSSGYIDLDRFTSGFHPSDLVILAARPSMGKTALCLNMAASMAVKDRKSVGIFSLEMSKESLVQRLVCADAEIDMNRIKTGRLHDNDWKRLMKSFGRLDDCNIYIDDSPGINAMELRAKARRIKAEKGLDIIILDYLQLMQGTKMRSENRTQEISEIARMLKSIARDLEVPIIALSQLSRAIEQRPDKRPKLSDLRESGEIEQTADIVLFIHREDYYGENASTTSLADIIIAKHRNGPTGQVQLVFRRDITKFHPKEYQHDNQ